MRRQYHQIVQRITSVAAYARIVSFGMLFTFAIGTLPTDVAGQPPAGQFDRKFVRKTVESLAKIVQREYFDSDLAARVDASLKERLAQGRYAEVTTPELLAKMLTRDLFAVTQDKHLAVEMVRDVKSTAASAKRTAPSREARGRRENFGVQRVEILAGNVGYLKLTAFYRLDEARDTVSAAMSTLRYADAIILDMRSNSGGSPGTVALLASNFFDAPQLPLFRIFDRSGESREYSTEKTPLPVRNESRPVYVLTSRHTFSAGEGIAFLLQERGRAKVVGETTAGAANPGRPFPVNSRFNVTVPTGKSESAVTGQNWEGSGVSPDVPVPAADALRVAHIRALRELLGQAPDADREDLTRELQALEGMKR